MPVLSFSQISVDIDSPLSQLVLMPKLSPEIFELV